MTVRTVAIMQPTYLPWIGYFDLMDQCDLFVLLDTVQFDRRSWQQRNRIKTAQGERWLTVPVFSKGKRTQTVRDVQIDRSTKFHEQHLGTIRQAYCKAPYFDSTYRTLENVLRTPHTYLAELTIVLIDWLKQQLGITTELLRSSALDVEGKRVDLLVSICEAVGATHYLSPAGARVYLEGASSFEEAGLELCYHNYSHPQYRQLFGEFLPYLSILDVLFNEGECSLSIIRSGRGSPTVQPSILPEAL